MPRLSFDSDRSTITGGEGCAVVGLGCLVMFLFFAVSLAIWYGVVWLVANVAFDAGWSSLQLLGVAFLLSVVTGAVRR